MAHGFNIRKANNRQGPGLLGLTAGKLTLVLADQAVAQPPLAGMQRQPQVGLRTAPPEMGAMAALPPAAPVPSERRNEVPMALLNALGSIARSAANPPAPEPGDAITGETTWQAPPPVAAAAPQRVFVESFEAPATGNYSVIRAGQVFRTAHHNWIVEAASVDLFNARARREVSAFDGAQAVDLSGSPGAGVMATSFATTPGHSYLLSFHFSRNNGLGATPGLAQVEVVGQSALLQQPLRHDPARLPFNAFNQFRGSFTADSHSATLRFISLNEGNAGIVIDAISIVAREPRP